MNCERCRVRMLDAAAGDLPARQTDAFVAHIRDCVACGVEFERLRRLTEAIHRGVAAQVAAEPSPEYFADVRRKIAADTAPANARWWRWAPAAACAAALVLATTVWMMWPKSAKPDQVAKTAPASNSRTVASHAALNRASVGAVAAAPSHLSSAASIRRVVVRSQPRIEREPEVLVPPGEAEAVMELAAALRSGKVDGTKLMADLQKVEQPIEIKPLFIAPLASPAQADDAASKPDGNGVPKNYVSGEPTQGIVP